MHIPRIYISCHIEARQTISLEENASNHVSRVLRMKIDDPLVIFNGEGGEYRSCINNMERNCVSVRIEEFFDKNCESPIIISLVQGISRGDRMDYTIQKAVELGVHEIIPVFTQHGGVQLKGERLQKKQTHWQTIAISACEQCGRNFIPQIQKPINLKDWLNSGKRYPAALVLNPESMSSIKQIYSGDTPITLLAGPEGGFSEEEIQLASNNEFSGVRLGPRILRTETAAIAAIASLQTLYGDYAI